MKKMFEAACPFYATENDCDINCTTWEDKMHMTLNFATPGTKRDYAEDYCRYDNKYRNCKFYRLIMREYEEKEYNERCMMYNERSKKKKQ